MGVRDLAYRLYEHRIEASLSPRAIPRHVGVMCDGNRRWARSAGLADVSSGHQAGADKIFEVLQWCRQTGVEVVTLWLLSTDNLSRPADRFQWYESKAIRTTWQASSKNKLNFFSDVADACLCRAIGPAGSASAPEARLAFHFRPTGLYQASWTFPATSKLLFEAGGSWSVTRWPTYLAPSVNPNDISIVEQSTSFQYNAQATYSALRNVDRWACLRDSQKRGSH